MKHHGEHDVAEGCPCDPTVIPVECDDGSIGWVIVHRYDGQTPEEQADRAACIAEAIDIVRRDPS